jgi:hypothetical protein
MGDVKFTAQYSLSVDMMRDGYKIYQKKFSDKRDLIFIGIFMLLAIYYIILALRGQANTVCYVLIFVCLAMAGITWYNPKKRARNVSEVFAETAGDVYECTIWDNVVEISTRQLAEHTESATQEEIDSANLEGRLGINSSKIPIDKDLTVIEQPDYFVLGTRQMFYILPKSAFEDTDKLTSFFSENAGKYYPG